MAVDAARTRAAIPRRPRVDHPHRILDDDAASPRARPFLENRIAVYGAIQTGDKALLSLLTIRSEQKRELVEAVHVFVKDSFEIGAGCVLCRSRYMLRFRHVYLRPSSSSRLSSVEIDNQDPFLSKIHHCAHRHLRATRFSTCLVRMPAQQNLAPSFIKLKIASSPSRLMTVRLLRSITSLRPSKSRLALLQVVRSSGTHGSLSFPSTLSLRWAGVSMMEILNMLNLSTLLLCAMHLPKPPLRKVLKALVRRKMSDHGVNECQSHD